MPACMGRASTRPAWGCVDVMVATASTRQAERSEVGVFMMEIGVLVICGDWWMEVVVAGREQMLE
jgi:hypothetical protein